MSNSGLNTISFLLNDIIAGIETSGKIDSLRKTKIKELETKLNDFVDYKFNFDGNLLNQLKEIKSKIDKLEERKTKNYKKDEAMRGTRVSSNKIGTTLSPEPNIPLKPKLPF